MTKKAYQYLNLDKIPYQGFVNVYGIIVAIEKKHGCENITIKDEYGHVVIVPDLSLLDFVEVGYILRLHRSMVATPTRLLYKPHIRGNSAVVWDLSNTYIPIFHTSSTYTIEDHDEKRVTELRELSSTTLSECQSVVQFDLTTSYKKKILSHVLNLPFEPNENYSISQRSALDNVSSSCAKTVGSLAEVNSSFLTGKVYFNFIAFVAEIFKVGQAVYVRVFDGSKSPISITLSNVKADEGVLVKSMPEREIIEKASEYLFDIACFGGHAAEALELEVGNVAVFANAKIYTRKMGDKYICLHEGEIHRRVAASVENVECEAINKMKDRCSEILSDLYSYSQSQSVYKFTQSQRFSNNESLNISDIPDETEELNTSRRKRKSDRNPSLVEPSNKRPVVDTTERSCATSSNQTITSPAANLDIDHNAAHISSLPVANEIVICTTTDVIIEENSRADDTIALLETVDVAEPGSSKPTKKTNQSDCHIDDSISCTQQLVLDTTVVETEDFDENSRDAAVVCVLNGIVERLSQSNGESHEPINDGIRQVGELLENEEEKESEDSNNEVVENNEVASRENTVEDLSLEILAACKFVARFKTLSNHIKKLLVDDDDTLATVDEEIEIIRTLEPDSPCVMENYITVDNFHFMNQAFYANCIIFTGNCDTCLNEFRVNRKDSIGCPFCLDKRQKSKRFRIGIRILFPIRKDFLIGLSREQIMHVFPSPSLDSDKVTAAFHANDEDFSRWCSDVRVIATSVVGTYKIRPNYCRTVTKLPTIVFVEDCDLEKKF